jgi:zinc transport system substrate-binding protein
MKKTLFSLGLAAAVLLVLGTGCASSPETGTTAGNTALAAWVGGWNNFYSYLNRPALEEAYSAIAAKEDKTSAEIKQRYLTGPTYQCEIAAMGIQGDTITFYTAPWTTAGSTPGAAYKADYRDRGNVDIGGRNWRHFETAANIPYKHLLLLPAEADVPGRTMVHFHFRYGSDLEAMKNAEGWYATMIAWDSTDALIIGHMTH